MVQVCAYPGCVNRTQYSLCEMHRCLHCDRPRYQSESVCIFCYDMALRKETSRCHQLLEQVFEQLEQCKEPKCNGKTWATRESKYSMNPERCRSCNENEITMYNVYEKMKKLEAVRAKK